MATVDVFLLLYNIQSDYFPGFCGPPSFILRAATEAAASMHTLYTREWGSG